MSFKKYTDEQFFRIKLEGYSKVEVITSALLYMEFRIKYNSKKTSLIERRCQRCLILLFEHLQDNGFFVEFDDLGELCHHIEAVLQSNGWESVECIIDSLDLRVGGSGLMPYQHKASLLRVLKEFLEVKWCLPVTQIVRESDEG